MACRGCAWAAWHACSACAQSSCMGYMARESVAGSEAGIGRLAWPGYTVQKRCCNLLVDAEMSREGPHPFTPTHTSPPHHPHTHPPTHPPTRDKVWQLWVKPLPQAQHGIREEDGVVIHVQRPSAPNKRGAGQIALDSALITRAQGYPTLPAYLARQCSLRQLSAANILRWRKLSAEAGGRCQPEDAAPAAPPCCSPAQHKQALPRPSALTCMCRQSGDGR